MRIDLNADLGEGAGDDAAMLEVVTSANIACGGHAGDEETMRSVCAAAHGRGVRIGAHPSFPDRDRFGREDMDLSLTELRMHITTQLRQLQAAARSVGATVSYLKPHGALYHRVSWNKAQARVLVDVAVAHRLAVMGLPGSALLSCAQAAQIPTIAEAFADRAYLPDGGLVPRSQPGAVLDDQDQIADRMLAWIRSGMIAAIDGAAIALDADSVCVHGDTPDAVSIAQRLRATLTQAGVQVIAP
ncbi:MAG: LamB/YcsF family protein [Beutenbergiaceae bacterium]